MLRLINNEDKRVALAIEAILPSVAAAVDVIAARLHKGGRLFYVGAGTSGRLGILDAAECPPTFSTSPEMVQGLIAGDTPAIFKAQEGAEDSEALGARDLQAHALTARDAVVGIAASGRTPYVIGALKYARTLGAVTIALSCTPNAAINTHAQIALTPLVGAEVIAGSTRLKAGTAQKLVLNMLSTGAMIKLGKTYGNLMVDLHASNAKLTARSKRIVMLAAQCDEPTAERTLQIADGQVKTAILMLLSGRSATECRQLLADAQGKIRTALKKVNSHE